MPLSSLDFLSPKITLFYNGHNSHLSHIGGLLSLIFIAILISFIFIHILRLVEPQINSVFIYEQNVDNNKYNQIIDYSLGITHFIQIYSNSNSGWFGEFNNKNIMIYGIKEFDKKIYKNDNRKKIDLNKTEHWIYDKCENIINKNFFSDITKIIENYTKPICLRFYYNPKEQLYYQIGFDGFIYPNLETNLVTEKRYIYKIIVEKCLNNSVFNNEFHISCNNDNEIDEYLDENNDIFIYFSNNQINFNNYKNPYEKYFESISSAVQNMAYFENDIIFSPIQIINNKILFNSQKSDLSYILKSYYQYNKSKIEKDNIIGIFNFYFRNNIMIYKRVYVNLLDIFSHIGGMSHLLFFIFQLLNYVNNRYTTIENSKNLFKINAGIDMTGIEGNNVTLDKMRHLNSQNYKIKVYNNNNIINNDDLNIKFMKNFQTKSKNKLKYGGGIENYGLVGNKSSKKNLGAIPENNNSHRKKNIDTKRTQTKYSNTFKQMGKQFTLKNKRKSYMSQGFLMKRKDYSAFSKNNQSIIDNDINDKISNIVINDNNNNSSFLLLKETKDKDFKDGFIKYDSKNIGENNTKRMQRKKTNLKKITPILEATEITQTSQLSKMRKIVPNIKGRHKSVNFGNQRGNFLFSSNLLGIKNTFLNKNTSEYVNNDFSSKQVFYQTNKNPIHSKFQNDKINKYDDTISKQSNINNNDNNLNTVIYTNTEAVSYLKTLIQNKLKLIIPEKQDYTLSKFLEKKTKYFEFFKFFCVCNKRTENNINLINNFRNKLLSEEHLYKIHINLYLLERIFEIDDHYKFEINELYNNL